MATKEELAASLEAFCQTCNENERLKLMNRDWDRRINIQASDITAEFTMICQGGTVTVEPGLAANPDLMVTSDSETLADIYYGDITPTEPYNNGTLKVTGSEEDILRLDFISLMIWGE